MGFSEHADTFAGRPVIDHADPRYAASPKKYTPRFGMMEDDMPPLLQGFAERPEAARVSAMVFGPWFLDETQTPADLLAALVRLRDVFSSLRHLFVGDIIGEQCEVSWLNQSDYGPLLAAYPALETLRIRGADGLTFGEPFRHAGLRTLIIETGGLPEAVVRAVVAADLPNLEHLELWLGNPYRGGIDSVDALRPLLAGDRFPRLRHLGLRNSAIADDVARAVAESPLLPRLHVLDLSLGTFGDAGADALLTSPAVAWLTRLVLAHHYLSDAACERLRDLGIDVDLSDPQGEDDDRYTAISE